MAIKSRNPIVSIVLSLVTCGIYSWYWLWCLAKDAMSVNEEESVGKCLLNVFFPFVGLFLVEKSFAEGCAKKGIEHKDNSVLYLILALLGPCCWVAMWMLQTELNKLAAE